ncbi:MAG TPA: SRPBCC family protein [Gaiellaceae bacterium]|nr:SRPBCC family protein [Gaiellaceae bacterium]
MARIEFEVDSPLSPETVLASLVDFGARRAELWPAIDPQVYEVHDLGDGWADVTEGSNVFGGIWAREHYDWSQPRVVEATIQESNFWHPGGTWRLRAEPTPGGGTRLTVTRDRRAKNARARVLEAMLRIAGSRMLATELRKAPALGIVES